MFVLKLVANRVIFFMQPRHMISHEWSRPAGSVLFSVMPVMQQPVAPPPVWSGPHIPAGLLPWQLSANTFQNAVGGHVPLGLPGSHRALRRTVSSPAKRTAYADRSHLFGEGNQASSPLGFGRFGDCSNVLAKHTSSPIEISDSPSSPSVITISSSSDEMEPQSLETNKAVHNASSIENDIDDDDDDIDDDDDTEHCDVTDLDDHCDGFGDDEDEDDDDDCVVTSSFSIGSVSPGLNESMDNVGGGAGFAGVVSTEDLVSSTTYGNPENVGRSAVAGFDECIQRSKNGITFYCSDTESADEKGEAGDAAEGFLQPQTNPGLGGDTSVGAPLDHGMGPLTHQGGLQNSDQSVRFGAHHFESQSLQRSPSKLSRPSSLGVFPHYPQHIAPSYISPTLPYAPSQTLLVPGNEPRRCVNDSFPDGNSLVILPPAHTQFVTQPLYSGVARISTAGPVSAHVPYTYVTSAGGAGPSFVNPVLPQRQVLSRGSCQATVQPGLALAGVGYPASSSFVSPRFQNPVVGPMKTYSVVPSGTHNGYGSYILNSSPTKTRAFYP